ncbi:galactose-1-phosphate uridylyltransferase [Metaclostridioides mangenotii]|uniref:galactose-1-phosphate uridylyltransferase n=1 Tax=Metaclostridioides mangenotii TaxID=1540 RepID=UPI0028E3FC0B|nr:galactose-1-phosphate uridylyltransferase [Clostridioides mangenotii]
MKELRRDKITDDLIIFAADRIKRPHDKSSHQIEETEEMGIHNEWCPFCRGNEKYTTEPTFEISRDLEWYVKSVYNKFPIIDESSSQIFGKHEVMVDTYRHNGSFYNMAEEEFEDMFIMFKNRYKSLIQEEKVEYVNIFKNFLRKAGASLMHPHSQIMSMSLVPPEVQNELNIALKYYKENARSLYSDIIKEELELENRVVYNGNSFLVIVPYATKYSGEVRVIFKDNIKFENLTDGDIKELSDTFKKLFENIYEMNGYMPFNLCFHTHPKNIDTEAYFNAHIHIIPRRFNFGGFELGADVHVSSIDAEELTLALRI